MSVLDGVRVIDFGQYIAGPLVGMLLADQGADVIRVDPPGGPRYDTPANATWNRGKRSIVLDLKRTSDLETARRLISTADVVIENFRSGGAARLGLDYEAVRKRRPGVVYCTISGFGAREPRDRAGYDFTVQAESGLMAITGEPDGEPMKVGVAIVDVLAGLNAATVILAALRRRDLTGEGDLVEVSLLDSAFAALVNVGANALLTGEEPRRYGNAHPSIAPYQPLRAADGWIAVAAANDGLYARLCTAIERPDLAADERYATNEARVLNREPLIAELEAVFVGRSADEWERLLLAAGVPAGKIRGVGEALRTGQARTRRVDHPTGGTVELVGPPFELKSANLGAWTPPPLLGQHTAEVLRELGVDDERLASLEERGVIARAPA